jgi:predicted nucleic acid-binding protein
MESRAGRADARVLPGDVRRRRCRDEDTAAEYGYLRASAEAVGRPIGDNGLWIAACASANGLPLVTLNRRHFEPLTIFGVTLL